MKKFEHIVIASDIDGTFLTDNPKGMERNRRRVAYFKENGGKFTFSTGRDYRQILQVIPDASELVNLPAVTCNGACLYDFGKTREAERTLMDYNAVLEMLQYLDREKLPVGARGATDRQFLFHDITKNSRILRDYERCKEGEGVVLSAEKWNTYPLYKLTLLGEQQIMEALCPILAKMFEGRLQVTQSEATHINVQAWGMTKAILLEQLVKKEEGDAAFLCVVGDYDNDLEMMALSDFPCCPSNAVDRVKAVCKECFCSNDEGVVADLIDYLDQKAPLAEGS